MCIRDRGSPPDVFDSAFAETPATLIKVVRYPARAASTQGVGAHRDSGVLTLLLAEPGSRGLQVRQGGRLDSGEGWIDVPPLDGAFIVNIGEMLEVATRGYLRATEHQMCIRDRVRRGLWLVTPGHRVPQHRPVRPVLSEALAPTASPVQPA